jgi:long-chain-fatty-acid--[acyl-carrier-protein] ligase
LVCIDRDGLITFQGRLKRFVKLGGEMISLPAIEAVLETGFPSDSDKGPTLAVEATDAEQPELVLFTSRDIDREDANKNIRAAGLSGLHSIRRVVKLDEIPVLGTGKTDYRALKQLLLNLPS